MYITLCVSLVVFAALMAGLTVALMSLDAMNIGTAPHALHVYVLFFYIHKIQVLHHTHFTTHLHKHKHQVCMCVCVHVCVVCARERARERERECVCVCMCACVLCVCACRRRREFKTHTPHTP